MKSISKSNRYIQTNLFFFFPEKLALRPPPSLFLAYQCVHVPELFHSFHFSHFPQNIISFMAFWNMTYSDKKCLSILRNWWKSCQTFRRIESFIQCRLCSITNRHIQWNRALAHSQLIIIFQSEIIDGKWWKITDLDAISPVQDGEIAREVP